MQYPRLKPTKCEKWDTIICIEFNSVDMLLRCCYEKVIGSGTQCQRTQKLPSVTLEGQLKIQIQTKIPLCVLEPAHAAYCAHNKGSNSIYQHQRGRFYLKCTLFFWPRILCASRSLLEIRKDRSAFPLLCSYLASSSVDNRSQYLITGEMMICH